MSYFPIYGHSKDKIEIKLDLFNYATKSDLQNVTGVDTSQSAKKDDLANLKTEVDKLDIDKLAKLDADKLKTVPINFKKFNDVADKKLLKKMCMMGWLKTLMPLILVNFLPKQIIMLRSRILKTKYLPTGQIYVRGIFVEHSHEIFPVYSENIPYEIPGNIPK